MKRVFSLVMALLMIWPVVSGFAFFPSAKASAAEPQVEETPNTGMEGMSFSASTSYQSVASLPTLPKTYEATIWLPEGFSSRCGMILGNYDNTTKSCITFEVTSKNNLRLYWQDANGVATDWQIAVTTTLCSGKWIHIAITCDGTTAKMYVDGKLEKTITRTTSALTTETMRDIPFAIGGDLRSGNAQYFKGRIKDVTLYGDVRTAEEITCDYAKGADLLDNDLIANYNLPNNQDPAYIYDMSGNDLHAKRKHAVAEEGIQFGDAFEYQIEDRFGDAALPATFEATFRFPEQDKSVYGGVIIGNYCGVGSACVSFEVVTQYHARLLVVGADGTRKDWQINTGYDWYNDQWTHLTLTWEGDVVKCYINGKYLKSATVTGATPVTEMPDSTFVVGSDLRVSDARWFTGRIKDITLYGDVRTAEEVAYDYERGVSIRDENLILRYTMPDGEPPETIKDNSVNGYVMRKYIRWIADKEPITDYAYSFAVVGDTQIVNYSQPGDFALIYDWLVANAEAKKMKFVFGLGDITDRSSDREWQTAYENIHKLDGIVPYSLLRGNHDGADKFNATFPYADYADELGGSYDGTLLNTWRELVVGDLRYLILTLDFGPTDEVLAWAEDIIVAHPNHNVIVTTHAYLYGDGTTVDGNDVGAPSKTNSASNDGDDLWEELIRKHENIVMVLSGHELSEQVVMTKTEGDHGNVVTQFLINPQGVDGNRLSTGMVAMMYFSEDGKDVSLEYYSTVRNKYYLAENQFSFELAVVEAEEASAISSAVSLGIGATYDINVYLTANGFVTEAGVQIGGKKYPAAPQADGSYKVTVATAYAKDLLDTTLTYYPYYVTAEETIVAEEGVTVNAPDLLEEYITGEYAETAKNLAQAALDYATVTKAYFAGEKADAATLARLMSYDDEIAAKTPNKLNKVGEEYTFALASLELGDTINFIFAIAKKDGSALTAFDGSLSINGKNVSTTEFLPTYFNGQKMVLAIIQGVPESQFAEQMTFSLHGANGETLATVDYSVQDYCIRTLTAITDKPAFSVDIFFAVTHWDVFDEDGEMVPEADVIRAVYAIGKAAAAYHN